MGDVLDAIFNSSIQVEIRDETVIMGAIFQRAPLSAISSCSCARKRRHLWTVDATKIKRHRTNRSISSRKKVPQIVGQRRIGERRSKNTIIDLTIV